MKKLLAFTIGLLSTSAGMFASPGDNYLLMTAGIGKDLRGVKSILENKDVSVNSQDNDGDTALMKAAMYDNLPIVEYLLQKGADVNLANKQGRTALIWLTIRAGKDAFPIAKLLIEKGANLEHISKDGKTALLFAVTLRNEKLVKLLLENNANLHHTTKDGETALSIAQKNKDDVIVDLLQKATNKAGS